MALTCLMCRRLAPTATDVRVHLLVEIFCMVWHGSAFLWTQLPVFVGGKLAEELCPCLCIWCPLNKLVGCGTIKKEIIINHGFSKSRPRSGSRPNHKSIWPSLQSLTCLMLVRNIFSGVQCIVCEIVHVYL